MIDRRASNESGRRSDSGDETADTRYAVATFLSALVPTTLARRSIRVSITTDRDVYERDEPVELTVDFTNPLPIPVSVPTPTQRRWGWTIDGLLEASDDRRYVRERSASFDFRGGERKRASITWNGRFERTRRGALRESVVPDPGEYEIRAFVATHADAVRPSDSTTITIR